MARSQYNSVADRKFQQRYQRIQERKESMWDIETPRDERRRQKRTQYKQPQINIDPLVNQRIAVLCNTSIQIRQIYNALTRFNAAYTTWTTVSSLEVAIARIGVVAVGLIESEWFFEEGTVIRALSEQDFRNKGYEIISFHELVPVRDLGRVKESAETIDFLLGI